MTSRRLLIASLLLFLVALLVLTSAPASAGRDDLERSQKVKAGQHEGTPQQRPRKTRKRKKKKKKVSPTLPRQDVRKYVECGVCRAAVGQAWDAAENVPDEAGIIAITDAVCEPQKERGGWLNRVDFFETDPAESSPPGKRYMSLRVHPPEGRGRCKTECRTVSRLVSPRLGVCSACRCRALRCRPPFSPCRPAG